MTSSYTLSPAFTTLNLGLILGRPPTGYIGGPFTYTSIVQLILQANNLFYTVFELILPVLSILSGKKTRFEIAIFTRFWVLF